MPVGADDVVAVHHERGGGGCVRRPGADAAHPVGVVFDVGGGERARAAGGGDGEGAGGRKGGERLRAQGADAHVRRERVGVDLLQRGGASGGERGAGGGAHLPVAVRVRREHDERWSIGRYGVCEESPQGEAESRGSEAVRYGRRTALVLHQVVPYS